MGVAAVAGSRSALIPVSHPPGLGSPVRLSCHSPDIPVSRSLEGSGAAGPSSGPFITSASDL